MSSNLELGLPVQRRMQKLAFPKMSPRGDQRWRLGVYQKQLWRQERHQPGVGSKSEMFELVEVLGMIVADEVVTSQEKQVNVASTQWNERTLTF